MKYYVVIGDVGAHSEIQHEVECELQIGDYVEINNENKELVLIKSRYYKDGNLIFFAKSLNELDLPPLIDNSTNSREGYVPNKYEINYNGLQYGERNKLFFDFFKNNVGRKVEVGVVWGAGNSILSKSVFIIGESVGSDRITPDEIIVNDFCYKYFEYRFLYSAKIIN
jgi:hypothetical protein